MKHPDYFTETERDILENYFIFKKANCKQDFKHLLLEKLATYGTPPEIKEGEAPIELSERTAHLWVSDFSHVMWDEYSGENLATHILLHPKFEMSNTRIKDMKKLTPNWSHRNKKGQSILHILAQTRPKANIEEFIKELDVNPHLIDNEGKYFTWYLLTQFREYNMKEVYSFFSEIDNTNHAINMVMNYQEHLAELSPEEITFLQVATCTNKETLTKTIQTMLDNPDKARLMNGDIVEVPEEIYSPLEKLLNYLNLQHNLDTRQPQKTRKI